MRNIVTRPIVLLVLSVGHLLCQQTSAPRNGADQKGEASKGEKPSQPPSLHNGVVEPKLNFWVKVFAPESLSNWGLVVFAGIGAWFAFRSFKALRDQIRATERATEAANKTLHITERADILIESVRLSDPSDIPRSAIIVSLKNFGRTRADNVLYKFIYGVPGVGFPEVHETVETNLGAGGEMKLYSSKPIYAALESIEPGLYERVMRGSGLFQVWGDTTYRDVFGDTHTLRYRTTWKPGTAGFQTNQNETYDIEVKPQ